MTEAEVARVRSTSADPAVAARVNQVRTGRYWVWYPNFWGQVAPLLGVNRNEALLAELGERAARNCGTELGEAERALGRFGWESEMRTAKAALS